MDNYDRGYTGLGNDDEGLDSKKLSSMDEGDEAIEEVRRHAREAVGKKVAAVAGAVEGFAGTMEKTKLPETSKEAIHQAGKTVRGVAETAKSEAVKTKDRLKGDSGSGFDDKGIASDSKIDSDLDSDLDSSSSDGNFTGSSYSK